MIRRSGSTAHNPRTSLVIGTAKDAGLLVYDLSGRLLQAMLPPNAPQVLPADPPTPAGMNLAPDKPCADSVSGETFGRFNNVDIAYDVRLGPTPRAARGRRGRLGSRLRSCALLQDRSGRIRTVRSIDITRRDVPRVFPTRYEQPSPLQPSGAVEGWRDNPVDDQNTVYGLTVAQGDTTRCSSRSASAAWSGNCGSCHAQWQADLSTHAHVPVRHVVRPAGRARCAVRMDAVPRSRPRRAAVGRAGGRLGQRHAVRRLRDDRALQAAVARSDAGIRDRSARTD